MNEIVVLFKAYSTRTHLLGKDKFAVDNESNQPVTCPRYFYIFNFIRH